MSAIPGNPNKLITIRIKTELEKEFRQNTEKFKPIKVHKDSDRYQRKKSKQESKESKCVSIRINPDLEIEFRQEAQKYKI